VHPTDGGGTVAEGNRFPLPLAAAILAAVPGAYLGAAAYLALPAPEFPPPVAAVVYGVAVVGAAFVLAWAAEAVQVDVNAGLALALLAFLAVLPEYAVDFVFAMRCGTSFDGGGEQVPEVCTLALANMTGSNRVLVGVGWPLIVIVATLAVWKARRSGEGDDDGQTASTRSGAVVLAPVMSVEVAFLGVATLYSLTLPLKSSLTLWDSLVFLLIFAGYAWRLSRMEPSEPELLGVSKWVGDLPDRRRRTAVVLLFAWAGLAILLSAEHFADGLVETGEELGVSQFLLVQWVAPLASESPELLVACLYAWRLNAADSLGTLLSSKVNQWTLLVGGLPLIFAGFALSFRGLPLDTEQRFELLITAAQSLFAVALLIDRLITFRGAIALLSLFLVQFLVSVLGTGTMNRYTIIGLSGLYALLAVVRLVRRRGQTTGMVKKGLVAPMDELSDEPAPAP
jgi:cation:H+ antiporter